jgi:hypothetical protein
MGEHFPNGPTCCLRGDGKFRLAEHDPTSDEITARTEYLKALPKLTGTSADREEIKRLDERLCVLAGTRQLLIEEPTALDRNDRLDANREEMKTLNRRRNVLLDLIHIQDATAEVDQYRRDMFEMLEANSDESE